MWSSVMYTVVGDGGESCELRGGGGCLALLGSKGAVPDGALRLPLLTGSSLVPFRARMT